MILKQAFILTLASIQLMADVSNEEPQPESHSIVQFAARTGDEKSLFTLASASDAQFTTASFPLSCHWMMSKSSDLRRLQLEDGSVWEIANRDASTLDSWRNDDPLFISPASSWFYSQNYYITNRTDDSYVRANLVEGPTTYGPYSHWITGVDIDLEKSLVDRQVDAFIYLENQTVWYVDPADASILNDRKSGSEWGPNDPVIIILSKNSKFDHILINATTGTQIHVKQR
jgi:hypothetical protein